MDAFVLCLMVLSGLGYAGYNTLTGYLLRQSVWKGRAGAMTALHLLSASLTLLALTAFTGGPKITAALWFAMCATGTLNIGIAYAKIRARELEEVSLVTPIDSTTPAIVILTAMLILGERTSWVGWAGIWLVAVGTYVLNIQALRQKLIERLSETMPRWRRELSIWLAPFLALGRSRGVRWAFFAVLLSTVSLPYDGLTGRSANPAFGLAGISFIAGTGNLVFALRRGEFKGMQPRTIGGSFWLGLLFALAGVLTAWAFNFSTVPYVGTMKRLQIPLTIVLAAVFLKERANFRSRIAGGLIMVTGAVLIALA